MNSMFRPTEQRLAAPIPTPLKARERLNCPDLVALVGYHNKAIVLSKFVSASADSFARAVNHLPGGIDQSTNITAAIRTATELLAQAPQGMIRRVWLLTDGQDNMEVEALMGEVARASANRININTIGFGTPGKDFSPERLRAISAGTRTGKYVPVETAQRLGKVLKDGMPKKSHQGEATVFCIDLSPSMEWKMGRKSKIEVVRDTMFDLLRYKQQMWS